MLRVEKLREAMRKDAVDVFDHEPIQFALFD